MYEASDIRNACARAWRYEYSAVRAASMCARREAYGSVCARSEAYGSVCRTVLQRQCIASVTYTASVFELYVQRS